MKKSKNIPLIKGYLPVRVTFPSDDDKFLDESFFFVKEHFATSGDAKHTTLFVANVPLYPNISTKMLLQSLLGRFADIDRITVVENPRHKKDVQESISPWDTEKNHYLYPSIQGPKLEQGRFAHVVFRSPKEMKKAMSSLQKVMLSGKESSSLNVESLEIQTLQDESLSRHDDESDEDKLTGILAVSHRYRENIKKNLSSRQDLMEQCNQIMEEYEESEKEAIEAKQNPAVDDDGFTTVAYSSSTGAKRSFEEGVTTTNRRKGSKRSRTKKKMGGATELSDFYRFQQKESRRQTVQELRKKFQQDLEKVKRLKDEKHYRPFS